MEWLFAVIKFLFITTLLTVYPIGLESNKTRYRVTPVIVYFLIVANVLIFLAMLLGTWVHSNGFYSNGLFDKILTNFGFKPSSLFPNSVTDSVAVPLARVKSIATMISYQFLHSGFLHLFGNMMALHLFGPHIEAGQNIKFRGHSKQPYNTFFPFLFFYILCGFGAVLTHLAVAFFSGSTSAMNTVLVGASGAISGIIGAYLVGLWSDYNKACISFLFYFYTTINVSWYILYWAGLQTVMLLMYGANSSISYSAHIGGFFTGMILWYLVTPWVNNMTKANIRGWFRSIRKGGRR